MLLRTHRRRGSDASEALPINRLEKSRAGVGKGEVSGGSDGTAEKGKGKGIAFGAGDGAPGGLRLNSYERPELVGGAEMDATPIAELHGDSKPFELMGSRWSQVLSKKDEART